MTDLSSRRATIRSLLHAPEAQVLDGLAPWFPTPEDRAQIEHSAVGFITHLRHDARPALMELFLAEFGLSTDEGVALMCLAEALLRVPDAETMDALIEDKIAPSNWGRHLGAAHSPLVNASTWALYLTGKVLDDERPMAGVLHGAIKRLGEPVIRSAVRRAMKEMGRQFVLGETIEKAMDRAAPRETKGEAYSYDMLGEAARTQADAQRYARAYADAIAAIAKAPGHDIRTRPGISVKLSALYARYEPLQRDAVMHTLVPRVRDLARQAAHANIGFNIDAEEADRLDLSLDVIEAVFADPQLDGWDGFGVVVQAYGKRASAVIDWLHTLGATHRRRIMVRLVKGAYWDTEIKLAQVMGLADYPVFTRKVATDASYLACAALLAARTDWLYPQFATHNAHTVAAVLNLKIDPQAYEFQRLHGMGEALHDHVRKVHGTACRIYAPVGAHRDLLAYLVRRLLENGANSSFVNQIVDEDLPPQVVAADPIAALAATPVKVPLPPEIFVPRQNAAGFDWADPTELTQLRVDLDALAGQHWHAAHSVGSQPRPVTSPATGASVGTALWATPQEARAALGRATTWTASAETRRKVLRRAADAYEANLPKLIHLLMQEAGKTLIDCINEIREAVDFMRYYADQASAQPGVGIVTCISPWNFPLAIFTGQIAAALAAGNAVLAKPAEATGLIADFAVGLLHGAGVPTDAVQLIPGAGAEIGPVLTGTASVAAVAFTGSTATAQSINRTMAANLTPGAPLIAETGGLNAMIVDSTALPEQAVRDIVASAFQSAGQRCSALRMLYLQEDIAHTVLTMLKGAMDTLVIGDPMDFATDVGPVIDASAKAKIDAHVAQGTILHQVAVPNGNYVAPTLLKVTGIADLHEEIFGPICHVATYKARDLESVVTAINATGYGLTFGFHSRIDDRVETICQTIDAGNIYINRNQIGAVVESQPFGGHGLSGTGPKAGGPRYIARFRAREGAAPLPNLTKDLPGPTGEANRYLLHPRGDIACLGPTADDETRQMAEVHRMGATPMALRNTPAELLATASLEAAVYWGDDGGDYAKALAARKGAIVPLLTDHTFGDWLVREQVISIDTTASGGNVQLLAQMDAPTATAAE